MPRKNTYKPGRVAPPPPPGTPPPRRKRSWLGELLDPEGLNINIGRPSKKDQKQRALSAAKHAAKKKALSPVKPRKMLQWERLEWVTDKLRRSWSHRKIVLEFAKQFGMSKVSSQKYIARCYKDFQEQFTDPSKRNLLMAEHCASIKEGMKTALAVSDLASYNQLARQYAEIVGILTPAHLLKFHVEDNRQQVMVGNIDEARATLSALEHLSEQDLFQTNREPRLLETQTPIEVGHPSPGALIEQE